MNNPFESTRSVKSSLNTQKYIASDEISTIVYLSQKLGKPLLAEGPAGVGKTELAKAIAGATGRELIRLQCYEGRSEEHTSELQSQSNLVCRLLLEKKKKKKQK